MAWTVKHIYSAATVGLISAAQRRIWEAYGLTPSLRYTYTHNQSNIGSRVFDAHRVLLTLAARPMVSDGSPRA